MNDLESGVRRNDNGRVRRAHRMTSIGARGAPYRVYSWKPSPRLRDRDMAWKLAFLEWRSGVGVARGGTFKPIPAAWYGAGFATWMAQVAQRENLPPATDLDWEAVEARGWERQREVRRLDLLRLAFRRPLEIWLALDRALYLERHGYHVTLSEFCSRRLTPRNLLISARRIG